jgi:hypothetical protein
LDGFGNQEANPDPSARIFQGLLQQVRGKGIKQAGKPLGS